MDTTPFYFLAAWNIALLTVAIFKTRKRSLVWPSFSSAKMHNRLAAWATCSSMTIFAALAIRFSWAEHFDKLYFLDIVGKTLSFIGFIATSYFVLAPSELKIFLSEFVPNAVGWSLIGAPLGFIVGGSVGKIYEKSNAAVILEIGISSLFYALPLVTLIEKTANRSTVDGRRANSLVRCYFGSRRKRIAVGYRHSSFFDDLETWESLKLPRPVRERQPQLRDQTPLAAHHCRVAAVRAIERHMASLRLDPRLSEARTAGAQ